MLERILELLRQRNLTPSQFADEIGIQRSGMSHLISGRNKPSLEFVMKVMQRFPDVKADWLLYGTKDQGADSGEDIVMEPKVAATTLFDDPVLQESSSVNKAPRIVRKEKPERRIEKIVIFYDDRSFREYEPEK
jgi:transcriptional regulator with XRE-family HTH domain